MKIALLIILPLLTIGCASPVIKIPDIEKSNSIVINDLRPESEKQSEIFSYSISNDAYGIYRKGDSDMVPPKPKVLRHRAYEKFSDNNLLSEINIYHMVVYWNNTSALRTGVFFGAIGAAVATTNDASMNISRVDRKVFESLASEEYKRALYTKEENPESASVYVIYIDAEINGKRMFIRAMTPSTTAEGDDAHAIAVDSTVNYFLNQY